MSQYDQSNYYRSHGIDSEQRKYKLSSSRHRQGKQSRGKYHDPSLSEDKYEYMENTQEMKAEIQRLKKALKQSNAKRSSLVKECSEYQKQIEQLEQDIQRLGQKADEQKIDKEGDRYRVEELRFLNKQLGDEINELREENETLMDKVRYCSEVVEKKYDQLEERMMKRMEQAMKRVKKAVHYLETLSIKDIEKTKEILIENLKKANDLLKGKYTEDHNAEHEIQELMNPLKTLQQQLSQKSKELNFIKNENKKLIEQVKKHKRIQHQLLPQYKQSIQGLKKNLAQVRAQLSQNEVQKVQIKKKYEEKIRNVEQQHQELLIEYRKNKLEKKIFQNKLEELQQEKEEEKQRLVGENQMLKKLYDMKRKTSPAYNKEELNESNDSEQPEVPLKDTDIKPSRAQNFKRKPYHQQSYDNENSNIQGYNSADYYNNHKTTKNTYGDQPAEERRIIKKNQSFKDLKGLRANKDIEDHSRVRKDTGVRSVHNLSRQRPTPSYQKDRKYAGQTKRVTRPRGYEESDEKQHDSRVRSEDEQNQQYGYGQEEDSEFHQEQSSMISQQSLKNEICRIDQEIMEIQKNLTKELQAYK